MWSVFSFEERKAKFMPSFKQEIYISGFRKIVEDSVMYEKKKSVEKSPAGAISKNTNYLVVSTITPDPGRDLYQVIDLHGP